MTRRFCGFGVAIGFVVLSGSAPALAQDAGDDDAAIAADDVATTDAGDDVVTPGAPSCPDAPTTASAPVAFVRSGPVDFGPGTGMSLWGDHDLGLEYNLLFSGTYETGMRGQLHVDWPRALTVSATGDDGGGYLDVTFGLRMLANLWVLGTSIPIDLSSIIDDHNDHGRSTFTPWQWDYPGTEVHLTASAWRTIYHTTVNVAGHDIDIDLQARYDMIASVRTVEIGFPVPGASSASAASYYGQIDATHPNAIIPPPADGSLDLLTRWKPMLRYQGTLEFRIDPSCADDWDLECEAAVWIAGHSIESPPIVQSHESLPDPYDQSPHFALPHSVVDPMELDFGDVHVGDPVTETLAIDNRGAATVAPRITAPGDPQFRLGTYDCVAAGTMAHVPVTFTPRTAGHFTTEVDVYSNGIGASPVHVTLLGNGVTGPTRPPTARDGGVGDGGDGGHHGATTTVDDFGCGCSTPGHDADRRGGAGALAVVALAGFVRRRRRGC